MRRGQNGRTLKDSITFHLYGLIMLAFAAFVLWMVFGGSS